MHPEIPSNIRRLKVRDPTIFPIPLSSGTEINAPIISMIKPGIESPAAITIPVFLINRISTETFGVVDLPIERCPPQLINFTQYILVMLYSDIMETPKLGVASILC